MIYEAISKSTKLIKFCTTSADTVSILIAILPNAAISLLDNSASTSVKYSDSSEYASLV